MKTNYILIDYENVQPAALTVLDQEYFKVIVFVGANQSKITFEIAAALQHMGSRATYVRIAGTGPNALDFHIAYYIGHLATQEPDAYFHIISKDTGFDPLIQYLKNQKIRVYRSRDVNDMPIVKAATAFSPSEQVAVILTNFQQRGPAKPRTVKSLSGTIDTLFQKRLSAEEIALLVQTLQMQGVIQIQDTKVTYSFPI